MAESHVAIQFAQYAALRSVAAVLHAFDIEQNLHTAASVGSMFYRLSRRRRVRAEGHIARSFPDWPATRVAEVAERSMQYMFQLFLVDSIVTPRLITPTTWEPYLQFGQIEPLLTRLHDDEPVILVTGHCGNWELLGHAVATVGFPLAALARPLDNRFIDRWLMGIRQSSGLRIITKWGATPVIEQIIEDGGRIGFIADQNAGDQGLFVPFFGRLASSYKSIGLLAMRHRVPIAVGAAHRVDGRMKYEIGCFDYITPEQWERHDDPLFYITARYNRAMEQMIRRCPEQYLWVHRRWKSRPRHERLGRPMPARLIEKLRTLPWMTDDELGRVVENSEREASAAG